MMVIPDFEAWAVFARVAELRSFAAAAKALGLSAATVSKAVSRLETRIGSTLIHRSTRNLSLTPLGQELAARAAALLSDAEEAEGLARDGAANPRGLVRIAAPMTFGAQYVAPLLPAIHVALPDVAIDLQLDDASTDLVAQGFDIAIRIGWPRVSTLKSRKLCDVPSVIVAAPAYVAKHGAPQTPADLVHHACLAYTHVPPPDRWRLINERGDEVRVPVRAILTSNNGDALLPMLFAGQGIAVMPRFTVDDALADDRLVTLLPGWGMPLAGLYLVSPSSGPRPARVGAVLDRLATALSPLPERKRTSCTTR